ncbi:MAG: hypothetical protein P1U41_09255 [Vicingaceae bacterium]|nr:hypothetical protein [Vicingaceae bacterium]
MSKIEKIETSAASYYIENNILFMRAKQDANFTLEVTIEGIEGRKKMQAGKKLPALIDMRLMSEVSEEAKEYSAREEVTDLYIAMAILTGKSLAANIVGNFFINFNKPNIPTKLFKSESKALAWLETFRNNE